MEEMKGLTAGAECWQTSQCHDFILARCDRDQLFDRTAKRHYHSTVQVRVHARYPALAVSEQTWFAWLLAVSSPSLHDSA